MSTDLSDQKFQPASSAGQMFPVNQKDGAWSHLRPIPTPQELRSDHLWGIPLQARVADENGKFQKFTDALLQQQIAKSVETIETLSHLALMPRLIQHRAGFNRVDYMELGFLRLPERPISSIVSLTITMANDTDIYVVPNEWISTAYLDQGQINIIPQTLVTGAGAVVNSAAGAAAFLATLNHSHWIPAWWQATYMTGFVDGLVPNPVWDAIACQAAMDVLSRLAATVEQNSGSLGIDGLSQSSSGPGPQLYDPTIAKLQERRDMVVKKMKVKYGKSFIINTL